MPDKLTKLIRPRWMFEALAETRRELSLDDPWLIETLWETARLGLVWDRQLRALYIDGVDEGGWQAVIDLIRDTYPEQQLQQHSTEPTTLAGFTYQKALEAARAESEYFVNFNVQGMWLCLNFEDWDAMDPTISAREVHEGNFGALVELMIKLSHATSQVCYLADSGDYPNDVSGTVVQAIDSSRRVAIVPVPPYVAYADDPHT